MMRYQLLIEYVGTNFRGWQIQKKGLTIQGLIQEKLKKLLKEKQDTKLDFNILSFLKKFINNFQKYLKDYKKQEIIFLRHGKTEYNDGTFLGIGRNPSIINEKKISRKLNFLKKKKLKIVYSSSLKRSIETAETFEKIKNIITTKLIVEKDYGLAEGLNFLQLKKKYPMTLDVC